MPGLLQTADYARALFRSSWKARTDELPTVTLRILPAVRVSSEAMVGPFSILDFPMVGQPSISYALHALGEERQDKSEHVEPARLRFAHLRSLRWILMSRSR